MKRICSGIALLGISLIAGFGQGVAPEPDPGSTTVYITADDPTASEAGPSTGLITVHRTGVTTDALTVHYQVGGTAVSPGDYAPLSGTVVIPKGATSASILVKPEDDDLAEESETVVVTLVSPIQPLAATSEGVSLALYEIGQPSRAAVTIRDNDLGQVTLPTVSIRATAPNAREPGTAGRIVISRLGSTKDALQVAYDIVADPIDSQQPLATATATVVSPIIRIPPATAGVDYQALAGAVTIPAGKSSVVVTIQPIDDTLVEGNEHVTLKLKTSDTYRINLPATATVLIHDNDPTQTPPTVQIVAPKHGEVFRAGVDIPIIAQANDVDGAVHRVEFFANGKSVGVAEVNPVGPSPVNPFQVVWKSVPAGDYALTAKATDNQGQSTTSAPVRIVVGRVDSGTPVVTIVASDPEALEADPLNPAEFKVTRTGSVQTKLNVHYFVSGTAQNGVDYKELPGVVTIPAGETSASIPVVPVPDKALEGKETVTVTLVQVIFFSPVASVQPSPEEQYELGIPKTATVVIYEEAPLPGPKVRMVDPPTGAKFPVGTSVKLTAEAADATGKISYVSFLVDGEVIGSVKEQPFVMVWSNGKAGTHKVVAQATNDRGVTTTSDPIEVVLTETTPGTTLVAAGSVWKYLDNGSDQGTAWRAVGFDDSKWASGSAPLGYGDSSIKTIVSYGPDAQKKYITSYFRQVFKVEKPTDLSSLKLRLRRDDGAVVYLNGTEIFRSNMPDGGVTSQTLARETVSGSSETTYYEEKIDPKLLLTGENLVAVEVHQAAVTSSDLAFDFELSGYGGSVPPPTTAAAIIINKPANGTVIAPGSDVFISATAIDPKGYIPRVEFFANDKSIGVSQIVFVRAPDPGTPIEHTLEWKSVPEGKYVLVARGTTSSGEVVTSAPVVVTVTAANTTASPGLKMAQRVAFKGSPGQWYSIQASTDLQSWVEVGTTDNPSGEFEYEDAESTGLARRFYRAVPLK